MARLLPYARHDAAWNMALDEALFEVGGETTLRFYGWSPHAISLGHFQGRRGEDLSPLLNSGMTVVRRMTGGGAIVHGRELTWSLCLPRSHPLLESLGVEESYAVLQGPIVAALSDVGIELAPPALASGRPEGGSELLCFHRRSGTDLLAAGKKLAGAAQRRSRTQLLIHGSILITPHPLQPGCAALDLLLPHPLSPEELSARLIPHFRSLLGCLEEGSVPEEVRRLAEKRRAASALSNGNR